MSIRLVNRALDLPLRPVSKLVLAVLADNANDDGYCWPSIPRVAKRASVSERTAQRVIQWLCEQQFVSIEPRYRRNGSQTTNGYRLFPPDAVGGDKLTPLVECSDGEPVSGVPHVDVADATPSTTLNNTSLEPPPQRPARAECVDGDDVLIFPPCLPAEAHKQATCLMVGLDAEVQQQLLDEVGENYRVAPDKTVPLRLLRFLSKSARSGTFTPELCFRAAARRKVAAVQAKSNSPLPPQRTLTDEQLREARANLRKAIGQRPIDEDRPP